MYANSFGTIDSHDIVVVVDNLSLTESSVRYRGWFYSMYSRPTMSRNCSSTALGCREYLMGARFTCVKNVARRAAERQISNRTSAGYVYVRTIPRMISRRGGEVNIGRPRLSTSCGDARCRRTKVTRRATNWLMRPLAVACQADGRGEVVAGRGPVSDAAESGGEPWNGR